MTPSGTVTVLHAFVGGKTDGANPQAALIQATDGNFYGTTLSGGPSDNGTVFQMTPGGTVTVLHAFAGGTTDGANPTAALIQATDGNFYGTTSSGGTSAFFGTVFKMTPGGALTILYRFTDGFTGGVPGAPYASLIQATDGNFYGTTVTNQGIHVASRDDLQDDPGRYRHRPERPGFLRVPDSGDGRKLLRDHDFRPPLTPGLDGLQDDPQRHGDRSSRPMSGPVRPRSSRRRTGTSTGRAGAAHSIPARPSR